MQLKDQHFQKIMHIILTEISNLLKRKAAYLALSKLDSGELTTAILFVADLAVSKNNSTYALAQKPKYVLTNSK